MRQFLTYLVLISVVLTLGGCNFGPVKSDAEAEEEMADGRDAEVSQEDEDQRFSGDLGGGARMEELNDPDSPLSTRVIYFDFDSSRITDEQREVIDAHADFLSRNPDVEVVLEGHTDERGTREYNLALGERRAQSVEQLLQVQGVSAEQIEVISFGEERPAAMGHDESAWRLNRRVEILYSGL
ncbi:peptidoglycan-associated lipoprotein Pal [Thiohalophilus thiocyanatoxydans]|uniref:Peptidoglycan-associated lipoprotein n=1 Tax=Thiohalophilus thiocyanatoxydans TaxID=381308 RepID=A0A4R8IWB9_9GAMM|nr:peptidoglycan-associated lipoprotein Pal [Thiohalophilus thiocyanatoxydans]TDY01673.1 peptidoglycan-associated lipoprotein [Thiohalophilus thiocyanatoxydans]